MKYLIKIDRGVSVTRPTNEFLSADNIVDGVPQYLTQDPTKDSYFIYEAEDRATLLIEILDKELASPLKRRKNESNLVLDDLIAYEFPKVNNKNYKPATELREGAVAELHVLGGEATTFDTYEEVITATAVLDSKAGWYLVDELNGNSLVIDSRPSEETNEDGDIQAPVYTRSKDI